MMPSTQWKIRNFRQKWYAGETISVAIGQGALTMTPLQLAHAIGGIAMGGVWYRPHLVKGRERRHGSGRSIRITCRRLVDGMYGVVNEGGTGGRARIPALEVCGKTGSAEVASNEFVKAHKSEEMKDNSWFVGFAQRNNPEIVVAVLFESGDTALAAPIARDMIKAYYDKKARLGLKTSPGIPRRRVRPKNPRSDHRRMTMRYFSFRDLDWALVIIAVAISALGVLQIYSATHDTQWQSAWWKHIVFVVRRVSSSCGSWRRSIIIRCWARFPLCTSSRS